jgi:hypothetical protein
MFETPHDRPRRRGVSLLLVEPSDPLGSVTRTRCLPILRWPAGMLLTDAQWVAVLSIVVRPESGHRRPDTDSGLISRSIRASRYPSDMSEAEWAVCEPLLLASLRSRHAHQLQYAEWVTPVVGESDALP